MGDIVVSPVTAVIEVMRSNTTLSGIHRFHAAVILKSKARLRWEETRK